MAPLVAVVGRPNVGKSTFVNRITGHDDAIVHEMRGVTRDRSYHKADWNGHEFRLIDTGGIEITTDDDFQASIKAQALESTNESDVIIFLVDGKCGIQSDDEEVANILRKSNKPIMLVVNKMDNPNNVDDIWEFYNLGLGEPYAVSSIHGHGTGDLLDDLVEKFEPTVAVEDDSIKIAIIGRPNAGKSSLTNCLTGKNRSIVSDVAGTTRDSIDTIVERNGQNYTIVDTAGLRKKSAIDEDVEYYSFVRAVRAIDRSDVAVLVIDSTLGLTDQDQRVAGMAAERGCALVIVLNKWDLAEDKEKIREHLNDRMEFVGYATVVNTVALTGKKVQNVWDAIDGAYENYCKKISTNKLNNWLTQIKETGYTVTRGKQILRMKYLTQTGIQPPKFTFFVNHPSLVNDTFERFLENRMRETFDLSGTPVTFRFKSKS
ncbi:MAG: ribosome biogenesis GTPase Der [Coriobacteriia bacterium]|nr:ribosome biogenesis GTPase Der [Coriobacteriia bacterium]